MTGEKVNHIDRKSSLIDAQYIYGTDYIHSVTGGMYCFFFFFFFFYSSLHLDTGKSQQSGTHKIG